MATYIAHNAARDVVTLTLSKAEANVLREAADAAEDFPLDLNGKKRNALERALNALACSTNTDARRAGFFD